MQDISWLCRTCRGGEAGRGKPGEGRPERGGEDKEDEDDLGKGC